MRLRSQTAGVAPSSRPPEVPAAPNPHPPGLWLIQVYRPVHSEALSHVQIVSPWFFAELCFLVTFS